MLEIRLFYILASIALTLLTTPSKGARVLSPIEVKTQGDAFSDLRNPNFSHGEFVFARGEIFRWQYPMQYKPNVNYGYLHRANESVRDIARTQEQLLYDSIYTTDSYSRRINLTKPKGKEFFLILGGCSFVFGAGLNDNQTLNHFINEAQSKYYAYNYGVSGSSINLLLARLHHEQAFNSQLEFESGDLVYTFISDHVPRAVGAWPTAKSTPYFRKNTKGRMEFAGSIEKNFSFFRRILIDSVPFFPEALKINRFIPRVNSSDYEYFCSLIKETNETWKEKHKKGRFVFAFHPFQETDEKIVACLEANKILYFHPKITDFSGRYDIPVDHHPNDRMNKFYAAQILEFLNKSTKL